MRLNDPNLLLLVIINILQQATSGVGENVLLDERNSDEVSAIHVSDPIEAKPSTPPQVQGYNCIQFVTQFLRNLDQTQLCSRCYRLMLHILKMQLVQATGLRCVMFNLLNLNSGPFSHS